GRDGNPSLYRRIIGELIRRNLGERDNYNRVADVVDIDAFADYIALAFYIGYADWPHNNYWAGVGGTDPKLRYVVWDAEWSWTPLYGGGDGARVHPNFVRGGQSDWWPEIPAIWRELMASSEFQMAFADRVYKHVSPGGALTDEASRQRWAELNAYIENAVVAESARWGDTAEASGFPTYTRDRDWREQVAYVDSRIQGNADRLLRVLREQGYYPSIDPPTVNLPGGVIPPGQPLELRTGQGEVVFTTDGTDPRLPGGGLNPVAQRAGAGTAFGVVTPLTIKARVQNGSEWSALFEAEYVPTQDFSGLMINEIMYQPQGDADAEYVELHNTGASALPLAGVQFADGIRYDFGLSDVIEAGDYVVLARDAAAFEQAHGFAPFGAFQGRLDNGGELLMLIDQSGTVIDSVKYDDDLPWPVEADSLGPSLELVDPALDNGVSTSWLASKVGGSPGQPNAPNQPPVVSLSLSAPEVQPGQAVQITVDATDPDGQVQQVAFFSGTEKLGEADAASFTFDFVAPAVGTYALRAEATDNGGSLGLSGPSTLFAGSSNPCSPQPADLFFNEINYNSAASLASD
ncbi:MAG: lamin tail domain-containing protein, partial [Bacteroidota bacterium]